MTVGPPIGGAENMASCRSRRPSSLSSRARAGLGPGGRHTRGVLGAVARTPAAIVGGALAVAGSVAKAPVVVAEAFREEEEKETVAERWVEFLLQQMDDEEESAGGGGGKA